jgi:hypothetical protein
MKPMDSRYLAVLVGTCLLFVAGCDNKPSGMPQPETPPIPTPSPVPAPLPPVPTPTPAAHAPALPAPAAIPLGTSQAIYTVDSLVISHPDDAPKAVVIKAMGSVRSGGWTEPTLEEMPDAGDPTVKSYRFVATSPTAEATIQALQTVEADLRVDTLSDKVTTIRVVSETNEISAAVH